MTKLARLLTATAVASAFSATSANAVPVGATVPATARAQIVKPLTLTKTQDLDFGTILMQNVTGPTTVTVSSAGAVTCGTGTVCSGSTAQAIFNVTGTNNQVVKVYSAATNLTNANDATKTIVFTPAPPASVTMPNSGNTGTNFNVGGSIALTTTTVDGVYSGAINVTVDYN